MKLQLQRKRVSSLGCIEQGSGILFFITPSPPIPPSHIASHQVHLCSFCPAQKCPTKQEYSPTSLIGLTSASALRNKKCFRSKALKEAHFYSLHKGTGCVAAFLKSPACSCLTFFFFFLFIWESRASVMRLDFTDCPQMSSAPDLPVWSLNAPPCEEGKS